METRPVVVGLDGSASADVVAVLLGVAAEEDARMIVVGSRGHREFAAVPLGSTSFQLVMGADRPVLVVPPPDR